MIERLTDEQYADLGHRARVVRLEEIVSQAGICRLCGTHYSHDIEEPFANCGCHTTEWSGALSPYQQLEQLIVQTRKSILPPLPAPELQQNGELYYSFRQITKHAMDVRAYALNWLEARERLEILPDVGTKYRHHNGNVYEVMFITNVGSQRPEYPVTVVYKGENGKVWSKPLADFKAKMSLVPTTGDQK